MFRVKCASCLSSQFYILLGAVFVPEANAQCERQQTISDNTKKHFPRKESSIKIDWSVCFILQTVRELKHLPVRPVPEV